MIDLVKHFFLMLKLILIGPISALEMVDRPVLSNVRLNGLLKGID